MPQRPEQHQLETASRIAFEGVLPNGWVFREMKPDYGIDGEVEIFENGTATGITFKVQLKATRGDDVAIRLDRTKDTYYAALRLPVLLVMFHQPTDRILVRWFHSFDPYSEATPDSGVVFRFTEENRWAAETPERLQREAEMFYRIRDPSRALPLQISIHSQSESVTKVPSAEIEARLRSFLAPFKDIIEVFPAGRTGVHGSISLSRASIRVDFRGAASYTMHYQEEDEFELDARMLTHDAAITLAFLLDHIGQQLAAARMVEDAAQRSAAIRNPDASQRIGSILIRAGRAETAIELSRLLQDADESFLAAAMLELPLLVSAEALTRNDKTKIANRLLSQAEELLGGGSTLPAAAAFRNAGSWLVGLGRYEEALTALDRALEADPGYAQRAYFHRERGGALFLLGEHLPASKAYARALDLGEDQRVLALYADALLHAGRFAEARRAFATFNRESEVRNSEWRLKEWVLDRIIEVAGDSQDINIEEGCRIAAESDTALSEEAREKGLVEALQKDGLCGQAWVKLGLLRVQEGRVDDALPCFVIAALFTHKVEPWMLSIMAAADRLDEPILRDILKAGYYFLRDDFAEAIGKLSDELNATSGEELGHLLDDVMAELQGEITTLEFRILRESGYDSLPIHPPDRGRA